MSSRHLQCNLHLFGVPNLILSTLGQSVKQNLLFLAPEREVARAGQRVLVPPGEGPAAEVRPILDRRAAAADPADGSENPGRAPVPWTIG